MEPNDAREELLALDGGFIIDDLLPSYATTMFAGAAGTGKTSLVLQMVAALLQGDDEFLGFSIPSSFDKSILIMSTDDSEAGVSYGRLSAIAPEVLDSGRLVWIDYAGQALDDDDWDQARQVIKERNIGLVVLDHIMAAVGDDLNHMKTANEFMGRLQSLRTPVLALAHTAKMVEGGVAASGKQSPMGSSVYGSRARGVLTLRRSQKLGHRLEVALNTAEWQTVQLEHDYVLGDLDGYGVVSSVRFSRRPAKLHTLKLPSREGEAMPGEAGPQSAGERWDRIATKIVRDGSDATSVSALARQVAESHGGSVETARARLRTRVKRAGMRWVAA
ncbi:AAA family ATPase [Serinicoccus sp. LYQ131]|uniref:AAA family ATPase n=1 Tax=Serinicoccus sp. LYQ131 TaxID=3378797 RepID=UPI0038540550